MKVNDLLRLPLLVAAAREAAGLSQRAAAALLGIHASQLCGMEKGRLRIVRPDFLVEFTQALGLVDDQLLQFRWALAHDQVVMEAVACGLAEPAVQLLSTALHLDRELSKDAVAGIRRSLEIALQSQRRLQAWESSSTAVREEDAMT